MKGKESSGGPRTTGEAVGTSFSTNLQSFFRNASRLTRGCSVTYFFEKGLPLTPNSGGAATTNGRKDMQLQPYAMVLGVPWFYKPQAEPRLVPVEGPSQPLPANANAEPPEGVPKSQAWTAQEDALLRKHYPHMSNQKLSEKYLPGRTPASINYRAYKLKVRKTDTFLHRMKRQNAMRVNNLKKASR